MNKAKQFIEAYNGQLGITTVGSIRPDYNGADNPIEVLTLDQRFDDTKRMMLELIQEGEARKYAESKAWQGGDKTTKRKGKAAFWGHILDNNAGTEASLVTAMQGGDIPDWQVFLDAKAKLGEGLSQALESHIGQATMRVRRFDEYDGELDTDRLDSDRPFIRRTRARSETRMLEVELHIAAHWTIKSHEITAFGAMVWATITTLESHGVLCGFTVVKHNRDTYKVGPLNNGQTCLRIRIKEPGEFIDDKALAFACHSIFYRKLSWALFAFVENAMDRDKIEAEVGGTMPLPKAVSFTKGKLRFSMNQMDIGPQLQESIRQALATNLDVDNLSRNDAA
jgi:hypothetical protein